VNNKGENNKKKIANIIQQHKKTIAEKPFDEKRLKDF